MKFQRAGLALALFLTVPACVPAGPPPVEPMPPLPGADACGASGLQGLVGQPESVLQTMRFSQPLRIIRPGMAVTMDYSPNRLNIELDAAGTIIRVHCG